VEDRLPSSAEVDATSDLNEVPVVEPVCRLGEIHATYRIGFCASANHIDVKGLINTEKNRIVNQQQ